MIPGKPMIIFYEKEHKKTLLISDLHIGFVYGRNTRGILIPNKKLPEEELVEMVIKEKPRRLIILGDFKDEIFGAGNPLTGRIFAFLKKVTKYTRLTIIKGNHDGKIEEFLSEDIEIIPATGLLLKLEGEKTMGLWHGHATPALDVMNADITISAHCHPAYTFRDEIGSKTTEKVWIKTKWLHSVDGEERIHIIMPAFNPFIEGYSVDGSSFNMNVTMKDGLDFDNAEVFTLDGVLLGTLSDLQEEKKRIEEFLKEKRRKRKS